ncbi:DUF4433 domain-containing protein [Proteus vulgaris]|uniref:DarT ssDNA thymidine ADP-ribosyltransferase family protein n=1 Tax=Proteus TaxID=583 RepID=UPI0018E48E46|nr:MULTISPECIES: DarT ssDNA thymidine ADP-ribosyltransferase family protein [Proteus]MBI6542335.1 DUF4433 domain-containing protein [Proteus vulgaris]
MSENTSIRDKALLYHLTCLDNLPNILETGLRSRASLSDDFIDVADGNIIQGREAKTLEQMVPFHFFAGNPFDGRVLVDNKDLDFCVITVRRNLAKVNNWKIIPAHPLASEGVDIMSYDEGMEAINWELLDKRDYKDTMCKLVCMAECLSPDTVLASSFFNIYVKDANMEDVVRDLLKKNKLNIHVDIMEHFCVKK